MAAATWTSTKGGQGRSVKGAVGSGSADAPTLVSQGINLDSVTSVAVTLEADYGQTLSGAGKFQFYTLDPAMRGQATVTIVSAVKGNSVTINGVAFLACANNETPTTNGWKVGAGGSADADSATALAAAINAVSSQVFVTALAAAGVVTLTGSIDSTDARANVTITKSGNPITLSAAVLPSPWALAPSLDENTTASAVRRASLAALQIVGPRGRLCPIPNGVTLSGGGLTWYVSASDASGRVI